MKKTIVLTLFMLFCSYSSPGFSETWDIEAATRTLSAQSRTLDPEVLKLGLEAYKNAQEQGLAPREFLTIVDYSKPSTENRFWVLNLRNKKILFETLVAHGKNSGDKFATHFSNRPQSLASSFGVFLTGRAYSGHHGYSLKLIGLERGVNDKALSRSIVVHAASYVNHFIGRSFGRLGRSWGCFALSPAVTRPVIDTIKNGTLIFAYYPDRRWLSHSSFLRR